MNITLPLWIALSQWTLLFALGWLVVMMYRQLAVLMKLQDQGNDRYGLPIGQTAPSFEYTAANDARAIPVRFEPIGNWSLLLFADPGCASCESALLAIEASKPRLDSPLHILVVTSVEKERIAAIEVFRTTSITIACVSKDVPSQLYRTHITPFIYLIDDQGTIRDKEVAVNKTSVRKMIKKVERNVITMVPTTS